MKYVTLFFTLHVVLVSYLYTHFWFPVVTTSSELLESLRLASCTSVLPLESRSAKCDSTPPLSPQSCRLAFAYSAVSDLIVNSKEVMRTHQAEYLSEPPLQLKTVEDVLGTFGYHFSRGIAGEYRVEDEAVFRQLVEKGGNGTHLIGGNGAVMALRAAVLGCQVGLAAPLAQEWVGKIPKSVHLLIPPVSDPDIHLVLEYHENQRWGGLHSPHSNRFYLNHDTHMLSLPFRTALHAENLTDYDTFAIGGLQMMQNYEGSGEILEDVGKYVEKLRKMGKGVHFEFADIRNATFYRNLLSNLINQADSFGFNEQELKSYVSYLSSNSLHHGWLSRPSVSDIISETINSLKFSHSKGYQVTRAHAHSPLAHVLCANLEVWYSPEVAVAYGALLAGQLACNSTDLDPRTVAVTEEEVVFVRMNGEKVQGNMKEKAVKCYMAGEGYECCVALVPYCQSPKQTRALGDNISGAGLALHRRKLRD